MNCSYAGSNYVDKGMVELTPLFLSIRVAIAATALSFVIGTALAWTLARRNFPGRALVSAVVTMPLVLPPTVLGYYILVAVGRQSPVGRWLEESLGITLVFTWGGAVLAAFIASVPLLARSAQAAFEAVDKTLEDAARTLGRSEVEVFFAVTMPLAWRGVLAGTALAFTRALGEFGATLMVAGNIPGQTQTMAIAIYEAAQVGNIALANTLVLIMTISAAAILLVIERVAKAQRW